MESISQHLPDVTLFKPLSAINEENGLKSQFSNTRVQVQKSSDITFFTGDGDRVTLSSFSSFEASYATYSRQGEINGATLQTEGEAFFSSQVSEFELSIEGHLDKQELKDLRKALKTIGKITKDFFEGRTENVLKRAEKIMRLDSISSFEAVLQYRQSLSVEQGRIETAPPLPAPTATIDPPVTAISEAPLEPLSPPDQTLPAQTPPALIEPAQTQPVTPPSPGQIEPVVVDKPQIAANPADSFLPKSTLSGQVESLVHKMTEAVLETRIEPKKIVKQMDKFLDRLFKKFTRESRITHHDLELSVRVQSEFLLRLEATEDGLGATKGVGKNEQPSNIDSVKNSHLERTRQLSISV